MEKDGFAAQELDVPPPPPLDTLALPPIFTLTKFPPILARAPVFPVAETNEAMFEFEAKLVFAYVAATPLANAIRSVSLLGSDPLENTTFGVKDTPPEFVFPLTINPTDDPVSDVTPGVTRMFGIAIRFTIPLVLTFVTTPLYVPRT